MSESNGDTSHEPTRPEPALPGVDPAFFPRSATGAAGQSPNVTLAKRAWDALAAIARGIGDVNPIRPGASDEEILALVRRVHALVDSPHDESMNDARARRTLGKLALATGVPWPPAFGMDHANFCSLCAEMESAIDRLVAGAAAPKGPVRRRLPTNRSSLTHRFSIDHHEGYIIIGFYPDGTPGEMFLETSKEGSTIGGFANAVGVLVSLALQYGVPVHDIADKFLGMRCEPRGATENPAIPEAESIFDYIAQFVRVNYPKGSPALPPPSIDRTWGAPGDPIRAATVVESRAEVGAPIHEAIARDFPVVESAPRAPSGNACPICHGMLIWAGTCQYCTKCGESTGGCG